MGRECTICKREKSSFILEHKLVCLRCDELMFDLQLELEEDSAESAVKSQRREIERELAKQR